MSEAEAVQLAPGELNLTTLQILGKNSVIVRMDIAPLLSGYVVPEAGWVGFMIPLRWEGDYVFNGMSAAPGDMFLTTSPDGYTSASKSRSTLMVAFRRSVFERVYCALSHQPVETLDLSDKRLSGGLLTQSFARQFWGASVDLSVSADAGSGKRVLPVPAEETLIGHFAEFVANFLPDRRQKARVDLDVVKTVRRAERSFVGSRSGVPTLAELCAAAGVGKSHLTECFAEVYGVSPVRYLRQRALSQARSRLQDVETPPVSVKNVALQLGFANNGRFASVYKTHFGELPSDTLARTLSRHHGRRGS